ncbi:hypothetical protein [Lentzea sp. NPDC059081]|uniref:hypothetical protein n=1 Tax=Lentzea sp. NPDC059081 TaxID=3346719 RepID=UPI0036B8AD3D
MHTRDQGRETEDVAAARPSARAKVFSGTGMVADVAAVVAVALEGWGALAAVVAAIAVLFGIGTIATRFRGSLRIGLIILAVAAVVLTVAVVGPERVRGWVKPPDPGSSPGTPASPTTAPTTTTSLPVKSLRMPLHMAYKPPQNSIDLETLTFPVSSTEKSADFAIECRDPVDFRANCTPGRAISYYVEPVNGAALVSTDSPDPETCRDRVGYSSSQVPVKQSAFYCMRTNDTYAVFRISSAPGTRPADETEVITVEVEVATASR